MTLGTSFKGFFEEPDCEFESFMLDATTKYAKENFKINTLTHFILSGF